MRFRKIGTYSLFLLGLCLLLTSCAQPAQQTSAMGTEEQSQPLAVEATPAPLPEEATAAVETPPTAMRIRVVPELAKDQPFTLALLDCNQALLRSESKVFDPEAAHLYRELHLHSDTLVGRAFVPPYSEELQLHLQEPASLRFVLCEAKPDVTKVEVDIPSEQQPRSAHFIDGVARIGGLIPELEYSYSLGDGFSRKFQVRTLRSGEERFIPVFADSMISVTPAAGTPQDLKQARSMRFAAGGETFTTPLSWTGDSFTLPLSSGDYLATQSHEFLDGSAKVLASGAWRDLRLPLSMSVASGRKHHTEEPLTGRVVDTEGNPVAGVSVNDGESLTGADGRFSTHNKRLKLRRGLDGKDSYLTRGREHFGDVELQTARSVSIDVRTPETIPLMLKWQGSDEVITLQTNQIHSVTKPGWAHSATISFGAWMGSCFLRDDGHTGISIDASSQQPKSISVQGVGPLPHKDVVADWKISNGRRGTSTHLFQLAQADANGEVILQLPSPKVVLSGFDRELWNPGSVGAAWDGNRDETPTTISCTSPETAQPELAFLYGRRLNSPGHPHLTFATHRLEGVVDLDDLGGASKGVAQTEFRHLTPGGYVCHIKPGIPALTEYPYVYVSVGDRELRCIGRMEKTDLGYRFDFDASQAFQDEEEE